MAWLKFEISGYDQKMTLDVKKISCNYNYMFSRLVVELIVSALFVLRLLPVINKQCFNKKWLISLKEVIPIEDDR